MGGENSAEFLQYIKKTENKTENVFTFYFRTG